MRCVFPALILLAGLGSCFSFSQTSASSQAEFQSPLDSYIENLRKHQVNPTAAEFTKICGVKLDEASHRFAFSNDDAGTWKVVPSLPEAYDNLGMDLVGTAEIWKNTSGTLIEEWEAALDVGGFGRTFYCFGVDGKLKALDATNYQIPEDGRPWGQHEQWILQSNDSFRASIAVQFIGLVDRVIPKPTRDID